MNGLIRRAARTPSCHNVPESGRYRPSASRAGKLAARLKHVMACSHGSIVDLSAACENEFEDCVISVLTHPYNRFRLKWMLVNILGYVRKMIYKFSTRFTNGFSIAFQIRWKFRFTLISSLIE